MPRSVRLSISAAVLALLLASCGVEAKDTLATGDTTPKASDSSTTLATATTEPEATSTTETSGPVTTTTTPQAPVDPALDRSSRPTRTSASTRTTPDAWRRRSPSPTAT